MSTHEIQEENEADEIQGKYDTETHYLNGFLGEVIKAIDSWHTCQLQQNYNKTGYLIQDLYCWEFDPVDQAST